MNLGWFSGSGGSALYTPMDEPLGVYGWSTAFEP